MMLIFSVACDHYCTYRYTYRYTYYFCHYYSTTITVS